MFGLSTDAHKKHIQSVKRILKKIASESILNHSQKTLELFFGGMTIDEIESHSKEYWAAVVLDFLKFCNQHTDTPLIRVIQPSAKENGYDSRVSVVQLASEDMPFLVDSVSLALAELHHKIDLMTHPVAPLDRTAKGSLKHIKSSASEKESWMHIELNKVLNPKEVKALEAELSLVLAKIRSCVEGWKPMLEQVDQAKQDISFTDDESTYKKQLKFLDWIKDDNFTFLGYQFYHNKKGKLTAKNDSALGLYVNDNHLQDIEEMSVDSYKVKKQSDRVLITKLNARPGVHRSGTLDLVGVLVFDKNDKLIGEHRFVGLFTSAAINTRPWDIPYINEKIKAVLKRFKFEQSSHTGKMIYHILETLPRDELMQSDREELFETILSILTLQERQRSNVSFRKDKFGRFYAFLVHIPRDYFNTDVRHTIQDVLSEAVNGDYLEFQVKIEENNLARLYVTVYSDNDLELSAKGLEDQLALSLRSWSDVLTDKLIEKEGKEEGRQLASKYADKFPVSYVEDVVPRVAYYDVIRIDNLLEEGDLKLSLYRPSDISSKIFRFKIFRKDNTIPLSQVLPILENLGLHVVRERPYEIVLENDERVWIQDFDLSLAHGAELELELVKQRFQEAFADVVNGVVDNDGFNKLLILGGLTSRQIVILRALSKYLKQTNLPFSQDYLEKALVTQSHVSRWLIELFGVRFATSLETSDTKEHKQYLATFKEKFYKQMAHLGVNITEHQENALNDYFSSTRFNRKRQEKKVIKVIRSLLDSVTSQDEDNIIRAFADLMMAILRTNFYQLDEMGQPKSYVSFKMDSSKVPQMPKPIPFREIFAYSPRFEAIHLRMGKVARGGLRWSDRYEDFRTEVLGLMKAQNVKNSIIVPVGSKGGFVVKKLPKGDRDVVMNEVTGCYQNFIRSMLDITDNIVGGDIVHPQNVIRYDEDDPYLVVAADKGTATFSDIANGISQDYGFWLGDAFASGGSVGYDHKAMGITAKGAWESVKRHFMELDIDCQNEDFSVVGIGDMMGDVFGNGMLLSKHICLKAAFNHMHIFLDPNPDSASSWKERKRMFELPRSSWEDYNKSLISKGGGIYSRFDKSIPLSPEVKSWLGVNVDDMPPQELIRTLLKSDVDLLWNGGIGTYVKAQSETHEDVGDSNNNSLRVNGKDLKCRVIGEGGNLGFTQLGRIEFAQNGGKVNTDFIDNSAGVDCSDHEVNIKILIKALLDDGQLSDKARVKLLESMTDNVSELVLRNNYAQTRALSQMEYLSKSRVGAKAHLMRVLEKRGLLDREIEFLPNNQELKQRQAEGKGLSRPELCVLLSYSKLALYNDILESESLDDSWFDSIIRNYFPKKLQKTDEKYLANHRLRNEIVATLLTSQVIDRMGATFMQRTFEDTGASVGAIVKSYIVATELFDAEDIWKEIESQQFVVSSTHQIEAALVVWQQIRHSVRWILNTYGHKIEIAAVIKELKNDIKKFSKGMEEFLPTKDLNSMKRRFNQLVKQNFPESLAMKIAQTELSFAALDVVQIANKTKTSVNKAGSTFFALGESLNLLWLRDMIEQLVVIGTWHAHARGVLRDELFEHHNMLTQTILKKYSGKTTTATIKNWMDDNQSIVKGAKRMMQQMRNDKTSDYATVMVAVRSINNLCVANQ